MESQPNSGGSYHDSKKCGKPHIVVSLFVEPICFYQRYIGTKKTHNVTRHYPDLIMFSICTLCPQKLKIIYLLNPIATSIDVTHKEIREWVKIDEKTPYFK